MTPLFVSFLLPVFLFSWPGIASVATEEFEPQLDTILEGTRQLLDEQSYTYESSRRWGDLQKNIGELNAKFTKTREQLSQLETTDDSKKKADLTKTVRKQIEEMKAVLEEVR